MFESKEGFETLQDRIESKILGVFGFSVSVIIRTATEFDLILQGCPFSEEAIASAESSAEGESLYVALLQDVPLQEEVNRLEIYKSENEEYVIENREIYLLFSQSIRNSKLANKLLKLGVPVTIRNWKTMNKLAVMARGMEK